MKQELEDFEAPNSSKHFMQIPTSLLIYHKFQSVSVAKGTNQWFFYKPHEEHGNSVWPKYTLPMLKLVEHKAA